MFNKLPKVIIDIIFSYDNTYHIKYKECLQEMLEKEKQQYINYVLVRSHCC